MTQTAILLHYMPIIRSAPDIDDWERKFCISICARLNRGAFTPSQKQIGVMQNIVDKFQASTMADLIEGQSESAR